MQRQRDHDALRSEYGGSRVVEMALRSAQDEQALKRIRDELNECSPRRRSRSPPDRRPGCNPESMTTMLQEIARGPGSPSSKMEALLDAACAFDA